MKTTYTCKYCNKQWNTNQARNGHQNRCMLNPKRNQTIKKTSQTLKNRASTNKVDKMIYRIQCAKCGKKFQLQLTQHLYNSGKYRKNCSRACANSRTWTEQDKLKKSTANKNSENHKLASLKHIKYESVHICLFCKGQFKTRNKNKKFCNRECQNSGQKLGLFHITSPLGGYRKGSGIGKSGWYKGIYCDSSWQLAYVIYHLEHGLNVSRNKQKRTYIWNNEQHIYIPDFITDQGLVQIKGYKNKQWNEKYKQNPDIKVLYKQQIKPYLDYTIKKYGNDFIRLYQGNPYNKKLNACAICGAPCINICCSKSCGGKYSRRINVISNPKGVNQYSKVNR